MKHLRMICLILIGFVTLSFGQNQSARVIRIKDADTFELLFDSRKVSARLIHIDAPEKKQWFGENAKDSIAKIFQNQIVDYQFG